ncbi:protein ORF72 [Lake sturgeon herpesvirus]|nr:protein ORF72 [Lake sturgeon herpesvirus]
MIKIEPLSIVGLKLIGWRYLDLHAPVKEMAYRPLEPGANGRGYVLTLKPFCYVTATVSLCLKIEGSQLDTHVTLDTLQKGQDQFWSYRCEGRMLKALERADQIDIIQAMEVWQAPESAYEVMLDNVANVALTLCVDWEDEPLSFPFVLLPLGLSKDLRQSLRDAVKHVSYHTGLPPAQVIKSSTVNCFQRYVLMALLGLPETLTVYENSHHIECEPAPDVTRKPQPSDPAFVFHYHHFNGDGDSDDHDTAVVTTYVKGADHWASVKALIPQARGLVWSRMVPPFHQPGDPELKLKVYDAGYRFTVDGKTWS